MRGVPRLDVQQLTERTNEKIHHLCNRSLLRDHDPRVASPDAAMIEAKEKAAWQAFKDKKPDDFKKVVDGDMVGVYADGIADMAKEMSTT